MSWVWVGVRVVLLWRCLMNRRQMALTFLRDDHAIFWQDIIGALTVGIISHDLKKMVAGVHMIEDLIGYNILFDIISESARKLVTITLVSTQSHLWFVESQKDVGYVERSPRAVSNRVHVVLVTLQPQIHPRHACHSPQLVPNYQSKADTTQSE